jgi:hypothetical protein
MAAVALSFAQEMWSRQRYLLAPALLYLVALVVFVHVAPAWMVNPRIVVPLTLPLMCVAPVCMAAFSYGDKADVLARESGYPRRSFTLPLSTGALVGWPMALGAATVAGLWLVVSGLVLRVAGLPVPLLWPALFAAGMLTWTQALVWLPLPLPALRIFLIVPLLSTFCAAALISVTSNVPPALLASASAAVIVLAYGVAVVGVAQARRGDIAAWSWAIFRVRAAGMARERPPFAAPVTALAWLEWRSHLFLAPFLAVSLMLLAPSALLLYFASDLHMLAGQISGMAGFPMVMGMIAGAALGNCHAWARHQPAIPAFLAARPATSGAILAVKFGAAVVTTLSSWALLILALAIVLPLSSAGEEVRGWVQMLFDSQGGLHGSVWLLLIVMGLPALTWKVTVDQFWIGLNGGRWASVFMGIGMPIGLTVLTLLATATFHEPSWRDAFVAALPWLAVAALLLKGALGALVAWGLLRRELLAARTVAWFAVGWIGAAIGLMALAQWLVPPEVASPWLAGIGAVVLALPLVRLGLAPLALDWNRHR